MFSRFFFPCFVCYLGIRAIPFFLQAPPPTSSTYLFDLSLVLRTFTLVSGKWQLHKNPSESPHTHSPILLMKVIQDSMSGFSKIRTSCAVSMLHCLKEFLRMLLDFLLRTMFGLLWRGDLHLSRSHIIQQKTQLQVMKKGNQTISQYIQKSRIYLID